MKIKLNSKLTLSLVSLFISLILVIVGNKNNICLSFGFMLMGASLALYAMHQTDKINDALVEISNEIEEAGNDEFAIKQLYKESSFLNKKRRRLNFVFYLAATLLMFVGFALII